MSYSFSLFAIRGKLGTNLRVATNAQFQPADPPKAGLRGLPLTEHHHSNGQGAALRECKKGRESPRPSSRASLS